MACMSSQTQWIRFSKLRLLHWLERSCALLQASRRFNKEERDKFENFEGSPTLTRCTTTRPVILAQPDSVVWSEEGEVGEGGEEGEGERYKFWVKVDLTRVAD